MKIKTTTLLDQFQNIIDNRKIVIYQVDIHPDDNIYFYYKKNVAARLKLYLGIVSVTTNGQVDTPPL